MLTNGLRQYPFDDGLVLAYRDRDQLYMLNQTASEIWTGYCEGLNATEIAQRIVELFSISYLTAHSDVLKQFEAWRKLGLLDNGVVNQVIAPKSDTERTSTQENSTGKNNHNTDCAGFLAEEIVAERTYQIGPTLIAVQYTASTTIQETAHKNAPPQNKSLLDIVDPVLAHLAVSGETAISLLVIKRGGEYHLLQAGKVLLREQNAFEFAMELIRAVVVNSIEAADAAMIIHGAAVAKGDTCIVLPGQGGSGKSTLAAALACSGYTLLGDDVLIIDAQTLRLIPVPMSLNLKPGSLPVLADQYNPGESLHRLPSSKGDVYYLPPPGFQKSLLQRSFRVEGIVFPSFKEGSPTDLSEIHASTILSGLLESNSTVPTSFRNKRMTTVLDWLQGLGGYQLRYSSLPAAIGTINNIFRECNSCHD